MRDSNPWRSPRGAALMALGFALLILLVSSIPARQMPRSPQLWRWDKAIHATEYAVLGTLVFRAFALRTPGLLLALVGAALLCGVFGVLDETYQSTVPGRDSSVFDMLADTVGACFACVTSAVLYSRQRSMHVHHSKL